MKYKNNKKIVIFVVDIKTVTGINDKQLKSALYSLTCVKYSKNCNAKILLKNNEDKEINETDIFSFNPKFVSKIKKVKLRTINPYKDSVVINAETEKQVKAERELLCDATIVRVMKSRKRLGHAQLIKEVIDQLSSRFQPQPSMIKKRIQALIDKEFLARSQDDMTVYDYIS